MEQNIEVEQCDSGRFGPEAGRSVKSGYSNGAERAARKEKDGGNESLRSGNGVAPRASGEGSLTKVIEEITSKIPSATFLSLALGSVGLSAVFQLSGRKEDAQFIGQWVPTILILGLYNKLVKLEGSE